MLAHAEAQIPAVRVLGGEALLAGEEGVVRLGEVGRAAEELGQDRCDRLQDLARHGAGGDRLVGRREARQRLLPGFGEGARAAAFELPAERRLGGSEARAALVPGARGRSAARGGGGEGDACRVRNQEGRFGRPAERRLGEPGLLGAERGAVRLGAVLLVRAAVADVGAHDDEGRAPAFRLGGRHGCAERREIVAVDDLDHVPAIGREAAIDLLGEGEVGRAVDRDPVGVVEHLEAAQPQVPGERSRFTGDALHEVAVGGQDPGAVVEERCAPFREARRELLARDRHADRRGETLAERAGRRLDTGSVTELRMPGSLRIELPESFELGEGEIVAREMQQSVEQRRSVPARQDEAIAIRPVRIGGIVAQVPGPQQVGHRRLAERRSGVAGFRLLDHVDGEKTQGIDRQLVDVAVARIGAVHERWSLFDR